jgi:carboxypeptidase T
MAKFTGWTAGQPASVLGATASGGLEDWAFNGRGLPGFAWEVGGNMGTTCGGFTPAFSCVTGFFNQALPALLYTASIAERPWHFGVGPRVTDIQVTAVPGEPTLRTLRITANDRLFGPGGVNAPATPVPPVKTIDRIQYLVDAAPADGHAQTATITSIASDGTTTAQNTISVAGLAPGPHLMYARSHTDQNGPYIAVFFNV